MSRVVLHENIFRKQDKFHITHSDRQKFIDLSNGINILN